MTRNEEISMIIRLRQARKFAADLKRSAKNVREWGDEAERSGDKVGEFNKGVTAMRNVLGFVKPLALVAALGGLVQILGAAAAGAVALTAALLPLGNAFIMLPAVMLASKQAMKVWELATMGVMDAVGGLNDMLDPEKFAALTPAAQDLAIALDNMKGPLLQWQEIAQAALFPDLIAALRVLTPLMSKLEPVIGMTASALGDLVAFATALGVTMGDDLVALGTMNVGLITSLGEAGILLAGALVQILLAAEPFITWMATGIRVWAESFALWAEGARHGGELASVFDRAREVMVAWGHFLRPLGSLLRAVLLAALPTGILLLEMMGAAAQRTADFLGTVQGQTALRDFFEQALPAIVEMGRLVGALFMGLVSLAATPGLSDMIRQVRVDLLPALGELIGVTTAELLPVLIDLAVNLAKLFATLGEHSGLLFMLVGGISALAAGFTWLITNVPGFGELVALFLGFAGVMGTIGIVSFLSNLLGVARGFGLLKMALGGVNPLMFVFRGILMAIAYLAAALGITFTATVGWIVLAAVAIVAAGYLIYKNWDWLKAKAADVFGWIGNKIKWLAKQMRELLAMLDPRKWSMPGMGGKFDFGIPGLASGGVVSGNGSWVTGEAGPELNTFDGSRVRVQPLTRDASVAPIDMATVRGGGNDRPIYTEVKIGEDVVARAVHRHTSMRKARR